VADGLQVASVYRLHARCSTATAGGNWGRVGAEDPAKAIPEGSCVGQLLRAHPLCASAHRPVTVGLQRSWSSSDDLAGLQVQISGWLSILQTA
jgi:hypothetical protein